MIHPKPNLVVILGTTGTGKSKLAVDLSTSLNDLHRLQAEVINGDSMQVYKGLDILTNKVTPAEMNGVTHHLMSFLEIDEDYTVERFRQDAIEKIDQVHRSSSPPIVVGGTGYYIQNLILPGRLTQDILSIFPIPDQIKKDIHATKSIDFNQSLNLNDSQLIIDQCLKNGFEPDLIDRLRLLPIELLRLVFLLPHLPPFSSPKAFPPDFPSDLLPAKFRPPQASAEDFCLALHDALKLIDPVMAGRWHWRDLRKVRRSLEVAICSGQLTSNLVAKQDEIDNQSDSDMLSERVPYRTLVFWLYADPDQLLPRLDARVDQMVKSGLIEEIRDLKRRRDRWTEGSRETDFSRGPYQAIGYREFESCTSTIEAEGPDCKQARRIEEAIELMKISTRQYAKSQVKWMKNKFLPELNKFQPFDLDHTRGHSDMSLYILDASKAEDWKQNVFDPASKILSAFLNGTRLPPPSSTSVVAHSILSECRLKRARSLDQLQLRQCEICSAEDHKPFLVEKYNWDDHLKSKKHKRSLSRKNSERSLPFSLDRSLQRSQSDAHPPRKPSD